MKSFKYTINGNVYKVHINSVVDDIADVEVNGTPYQVKLEKPAKKQMVTLKRPAQAPTTASGDPVVTYLYRCIQRYSGTSHHDSGRSVVYIPGN